jgi:hypothetical protein
MSKIGARLSKLIKQNDQSVFITKVDIKSVEELSKCVEKMVKECPETLIIISGDTKDNKLISASYVPIRYSDYQNILEQTISKSGIPSSQVYSTFSNGKIVEISYPPDSEQYAFKNVDLINGTAFSILKKAGIYQEESSEEEYGTDF